MKLLFIRLSAMGDVIHALPAANFLKKELPDTKLTWIVQPPQLELLYNNPAVDEVIEMPKAAWLSGLSNPANWLKASSSAGQFFSMLREQKFDASIDLQGLLKSSILGYAAGAPIRVGYKGVREFSDLLYTHKLDVGDYFGPHKHVVDLHLQLSEYLLRILGKSDVESSARANFLLPPPPAESIRKIENLLGISGKDYIEGGGEAKSPAAVEGSKMVAARDPLSVVLIPGTTWASKIWPLQKWTELSELMDSEMNCRFILIGSKGEIETNRNIESDIKTKVGDAKVLNLTGDTSILDLIALYERVDLVLGLDTGPLHLASAAGKPKVVAIHGSTPYGRNGPYPGYGVTAHLNLDCQPCFKRTCPLGTLECLTELTARHVLNEIEKVLD